MYQFLLVIYFIIAIMLIGFVLIQQGKGADKGASFGSGASGTVFGSAGSSNFLSKMTAILATLFFGISIIFGNINAHDGNKASGVFDDLSSTAEQIEKTSPKTNEIPTSSDSDTNELPK